MPLGTRYRVIGLLLDGPRGLIVRIDDGGEWELDVGRKAGKLLGMRVMIEGVRISFNCLSVRRITKVE